MVALFLCIVTKVIFISRGIQIKFIENGFYLVLTRGKKKDYIS